MSFIDCFSDSLTTLRASQSRALSFLTYVICTHDPTKPYGKVSVRGSSNFFDTRAAEQ